MLISLRYPHDWHGHCDINRHLERVSVFSQSEGTDKRPDLGGLELMQQGTVVRLIRDRGFGFLRLEDGSEVFFHHSSMNPGEFDALHEGEEMEFSIEQDPRGRGSRAANVHRAGSITTSP